MRTLLLLSAVAVVLYVSNPPPHLYQTWLQNELTSRVTQKGGGPLLGQVVGSVGSALESLTTTRQNYGIFSVYTTRDLTRADDCLHVLGIAAQFVNLTTITGSSCKTSDLSAPAGR